MTPKQVIHEYKQVDESSTAIFSIMKDLWILSWHNIVWNGFRTVFKGDIVLKL